MNIYDIEALTEQEAQKHAIHSEIIKDHEIYYLDLGEHFGFSALVFKDGRQIRYANDYALHHTYGNPTQTELLERYRVSLSHKLFTDAELTEPAKTYDEYERKADYLHNLYGLRRDGVSVFFCGSEAERAERAEKIKTMVYDPVGFSYYPATLADFVKRHVELVERLRAAHINRLKTYDYAVEALRAEMANHEYAINWDGDAEVLGALGFAADGSDLSDEQSRAYTDARKAHYHDFEK